LAALDGGGKWKVWSGRIARDGAREGDALMDERPIRLLSDTVINQIAAGEVVERPASVLKELMENALDAGATELDVEAVAGGARLVRVSDNGCGMSRDNALLAIERHATSKIRGVEDIERIGTLGFRGEALAAIAAVSRFTLRTRPAREPAGTEILISGGRIQDVREAGCPPGTTVEVRQLFGNVPARRKFLRAPATEQAHLKQTFILYALAHGGVGMRLTLDQRPVYVLAGGASLAERVRDLFRLDPARDLRPVSLESGGVAIKGLVGLPELARPDRSDQYVFINGRPASAPVLYAAIREGYHTLLPSGRYPVLFLFLTLDPGDVDVNVHPTKKEVRFRHPSAIRDATIEAIRRALAAPVGGKPAAAVVRREGSARSGPDPTPVLTGWDGPRPPAAPERQPVGPELPQGPALARPSTPAERGATTASDPGSGGAGAEPAESAFRSPWAWHRIVGQVGGLYVVIETDGGLVLMDPHAAHERVLFEEYMARLAAGKPESQGLLVAETVDLPPQDARRVRDALELLRRMGFGVAEFGGDTFVVDAVPACFQSAPARTLLPEIAACLEQAGDRGAALRLQEERIAQAACKASVKARAALTPGEMESLVQRLARAEMPYTCPHGRPTLIHLSFRELDRRFGRMS
jgi:DNA mismatch repair protein MutL